MSTKKRNLLIMVAGLALSVLVWSAVAAQDATSTAEPPVASTSEPSATVPAEPNAATTAEPGASNPAQERPFLGVGLEDSATGVSVSQVIDGSAAATAGLQVGDIITAINGTKVTRVAEVVSAIRALHVGDQVTIDFARSGSTMTARATLGTQPGTLPTPVNPQGQPVNPPGQRQPENPPGQGPMNLMFGFQYNSSDQSWTVTSLPNGSPLYTAGLRQGDVIKTIDGKTYDPQSLAQYIQSLDANATVTLGVDRNGTSQDIKVTANDLMAVVMGGMFRGDFGNGNDDNVPFNFSQLLPLLQLAYGNGHLGVSFKPLDAQVAQQNNLTVTDGALITAVESGSPAEKAGLKVNDVVTAVDGEKVDQEHTLRDRLIAYEPGDTVTLTVLRGGQSQDLQATLDQPQMPQMGQMFGNMPFGGGRLPFGNRGGQNGSQATPEATPNL